MGLFKKIKKVVRKVENFGRRVVGKGNIGEKDPMDAELGTRATAAKRLVNTQKQAGSGQISFNEEKEVE